MAVCVRPHARRSACLDINLNIIQYDPFLGVNVCVCGVTFFWYLFEVILHSRCVLSLNTIHCILPIKGRALTNSYSCHLCTSDIGALWGLFWGVGERKSRQQHKRIERGIVQLSRLALIMIGLLRNACCSSVGHRIDC